MYTGLVVLELSCEYVCVCVLDVHLYSSHTLGHPIYPNSHVSGVSGGFNSEYNPLKVKLFAGDLSLPSIQVGISIGLT